jgi:hypothetical protein
MSTSDISCNGISIIISVVASHHDRASSLFGLTSKSYFHSVAMTNKKYHTPIYAQCPLITMSQRQGIGFTPNEVHVLLASSVLVRKEEACWCSSRRQWDNEFFDV